MWELDGYRVATISIISFFWWSRDFKNGIRSVPRHWRVDGRDGGWDQQFSGWFSLLFTLFLLYFVASSAWWWTSRVWRTFVLLHILSQTVRHSRPYEQLWSGQVVKDDRRRNALIILIFFFLRIRGKSAPLSLLLSTTLSSISQWVSLSSEKEDISHTKAAIEKGCSRRSVSSPTIRVRNTSLTAVVNKSELERVEITHCRPAHHRALDLARVDESDKHDSIEEFGVIFEGKVRDQVQEQILKSTNHEEILTSSSTIVCPYKCSHPSVQRTHS